MELRHLRYFCAVAQWKGFNHAARHLYVSQSAISEQIAGLESEIGVTLLDRGRRQIRLTHHGEIFLAEAQKVLAAADRAVEMAQRSMHGEAGRLSIGFFSWGTGAFFPHIIREYRKRYPGVILSLHEMQAVEQSEALAERKLDIAFTRPIEPPYDITLRSELLYRDPLVAALPRRHPLAPGPIPVEKLAGENFVLCSRETSTILFDTIISICRKAGFSPKIAHTASRWSAVLALVEAGEGIGIGPAGLWTLMSDEIVSCRLRPETAYRDVVLAWSPENESNKQKAFIRLVREMKPTIKQLVRQRHNLYAWSEDD
jgi:DNA-binding transcriptional LysR family regulator